MVKEIPVCELPRCLEGKGGWGGGGGGSGPCRRGAGTQSGRRGERAHCRGRKTQYLTHRLKSCSQGRPAVVVESSIRKNHQLSGLHAMLPYLDASRDRTAARCNIRNPHDRCEWCCKQSAEQGSERRRPQNARPLDLLGCLEEVHGVVVVLCHSSADGQDVGVEDDILRIHAHLLYQQLECPLADAHLQGTKDDAALSAAWSTAAVDASSPAHHTEIAISAQTHCVADRAAHFCCLLGRCSTTDPTCSTRAPCRGRWQPGPPRRKPSPQRQRRASLRRGHGACAKHVPHVSRTSDCSLLTETRWASCIASATMPRRMASRYHAYTWCH